MSESNQQETPCIPNSSPVITRLAGDWRFCVAPMLDWTNSHCRFFHRLLSKKARLYTEMITTGALLHNQPERFLAFNDAEHPVAVQLGGSNPQELAACARICESFGYDEINLNVGCPSDRVQSGRFGACLMAEPSLVAECCAAMLGAVKIPVTVKCRIGIDDQDEYRDLQNFITQVSAAGVKVFIVHARKAWLQGLNPKQNREVPALDYERVYQLKRDFPMLTVVINGGVESLADCERHLAKVDGVMMGRAAYQTPLLLARVDQQLFGSTEVPPSQAEVIGQLIPYIDAEMQQGARLHHITRHIMGLYQHCPGAKKWRRFLSEHCHKETATSSLLVEAQKLVDLPPD